MISRQRGRSGALDESGFTLVELLVVLGLMAIVFTLAAVEIRHFWFVRSFQASQDEITSQLGQIQEQVVAETHPNVFGGYFPNNEAEWHLIRYNPNSTPQCRITRTVELGAGVRLQPGVETAFADAGYPSDPSEITDTCRSLLGATSENDEMVFFFGRGTGTAGQVTLRSTALPGDRRATLCVSGITGRVFHEDDAADDDCPEAT